eukprot:236093_1
MKTLTSHLKYRESLLILLITSLISRLCSEPILLTVSKDQFYLEKELARNGKLAINISAKLQCNVMLSGITNNEYPVQYYLITITEETKKLYPTYFKVTTCCSIDDNNKQQIYQTTFHKAFDEYWSSQFTTNNMLLNKHIEKQKALTLWCKYCDCESIQNNNSVNITFNDISYFYEGYSCGNSLFCNQNNSLDTVLYILSMKKEIVNLLTVQDDSASRICRNTEKSVIDLLSYDEGTYIIGVSGYGNETGSYQISLQCGKTLTITPETVSSSWPWAWITMVIIFSLFILGCIIWYSYQLHYFSKNQTAQFNQFLTYYKLNEYEIELKKELKWMIEIYHLNYCQLVQISKLCKLNNTDQNIFINACNDYKNGDYSLDNRIILHSDHASSKPSQGTKYSEIKPAISCDEHSDGSEDLKIEQEEIRMATTVISRINTTIDTTIPTMPSLMPMKTVIRRIDVEETRANIRLNDGEDAIQRVISHVMAFCDDNNGLDIYQTLAVRSVDDISLEPTISYPLKALGCQRCCKHRAS